MPRRSRVRPLLSVLAYLALVVLFGWDRWYLGIIPAVLFPLILCFYGCLVVASDADRRMDLWLKHQAFSSQSRAL